jgi:hypothetical protein
MVEDWQKPPNETYRYPAVYRWQALFGSLLFGFVVLGSVLAEVEAIKNDRLDSILHLGGFIVGLTVILLGLDFATRSITAAPDGLHVRWALRRSVVPWSDVLGWRYLPLNLIHIRVRRGRGWYVWPLLERYTNLLGEIDAQRQNDTMTS